MVKLIKTDKLGFEMFYVIWSDDDGYFCKQFWSERYAIMFIKCKWPSIIDDVGILDVSKFSFNNLGIKKV